MRGLRTVHGLLPVLGCMLLIAGTASAATAKAPEEPIEPLGFKLKGSHGFAIAGYAYVAFEDHERGLIELTVRRGHDTVGYTAPAKVTTDAIRANLGSIGRVDLVFHPSGRKTTERFACLREPDTFEAGTYEGIVEFNGEGGYTRARATRLAALPIMALGARHFCSERSSGESRGPGEPGARLAGISYAHGRTLKFQLNKNRPGGKTLFSASLSERHGGIKVYRELHGVAPASVFNYDARLRTATLSPPAPFSGSATLKRNRNSVSPLFAGDLKLAFPGRTVALDGGDVHVGLVHARLTHGNNASSISVGF